MSQRPSEPILASAIYTSDTDPNDTDSDGRGPPRKRRRVVGTGCTAVDEALGGGLRYGHGGVCCVSGERGSEGIAGITRALLVSHLLSQTTSSSNSSSSSSATVIDSSSTFDVRGLYTALTARLENARTVARSNAADEASVQDMATRCLDRVSISRVFDVEGMLESVGEMRLRLKDAAMARDRAEGVGVEDEGINVIRGTVADSQDEGEVVVGDMLDDEIPVTIKDTGQDKEDDCKVGGQGEARHMLIIDNLAQVISPPMRDNYVQGQALLTSFLRSLGHTAREHNMCIVLVNWTISYKDNREGVSAFASIGARPGLGKTLDYMVDVHLLVNHFPHGQKDEGTLKAGQGKGGRLQVMEVLQDREDSRLGRVALFSVDGKGMIKAAF